MNGTRAATAFVLLSTLSAVLAGCNPFAEPTVAERAPEQWALVDRYCTECHNAAELAGGFDFEKISPAKKIGSGTTSTDQASRAPNGNDRTKSRGTN